MKLTNSKYNFEFEFKENQAYSLVIENPESMSDIIGSLFAAISGEENDFVLWEGTKQLSLDKYSEIIMDFFNIDFNSKKIINALYSGLNNIMEDEDITKALINKNIVDALEIALLKVPYESISYNLDFEWKDLFKFYNVRIDSECNTLEEKLIEYIKLIVDFCGKRLLVLVNAHGYLSRDSIRNIHEMAFYEKMNVLMIENHEYEQETYEKIVIIDKDNCIISK